MTENEIWGDDDSFRLFVSHTSAYKAQAHKIKGELENFGICSFVAHDDIKPDNEWQQVIVKALGTCDGLLALFTPDFHQSNWTDQEIGYALGRNIPVIPVMCGEVPYGFIGKMQGYNFKERTVYRDVVSGLIRDNERMVAALITKIEQSTNYDTSDSLAEVLEKASKISDSQAEKLLKVFKANRQVSESPGFYGFPRKNKTYLGLVAILKKTNNNHQAGELAAFIDKGNQLASKLNDTISPKE